jgi:hypothetical protein
MESQYFAKFTDGGSVDMIFVFQELICLILQGSDIFSAVHGAKFNKKVQEKGEMVFGRGKAKESYFCSLKTG